MASTVYDNKQVEEYVNEVLDTYLAVEAFAEVDNTLVANPGEVVEIWRYTDTGSAQDLEEGEGNTTTSDLEGESYQYKVIVTQDRTEITREEMQRNPYVASNKITMIAKHIINAIRGKVVKQWYATTNTYAIAGAIPTVSELIMAQADVDLGVDNGINGGAERLCLFLNPKDYRKFQAALLDENVIVGSEIIKGVKYLTVSGIPFQASDLILEGSPVFATDKAVRILRANMVEADNEEDKNTRTLTYYSRTYGAVGLEFVKKALVFGSEVTITANAASNGSYKINGETGNPKSVANARAQITDITPATGYKLSSISVVDSDSAPVTVDANNGFIVPAGGASVTVTFAAI